MPKNPEFLLADGSPDPQHEVVQDFTIGHGPMFVAKSLAHARHMTHPLDRDPVISALRATVAPAALAALHDAMPQRVDL